MRWLISEVGVEAHAGNALSSRATISGLRANARYGPMDLQGCAGVVNAIRTGSSRGSSPPNARRHLLLGLAAHQQQARAAGASPAGVRLMRRSHLPAPAQPLASTAT